MRFPGSLPVAVTLLALVVSIGGVAGCIPKKQIARAASRVDLGTAYFREGDYSAAVESLREATQTDPRNWRAWNALAMAYVAKGQPELAEEAFGRALHLNPDEAEILVNYGAKQLNEGKPEEAVATFTKALDDLDYRNQAVVLSNLSMALVSAGRPNEALTAAREAARRTPTLCEAWFHIGVAQEALGDDEAAIEAYKQQIDRCSTEAVGARLRLGCLQVHGPVPELGARSLEAVLAEVPGTGMADAARVCLRELGQ